MRPECQLGDKGKIQHVIYLQFDNVHFLRDNPNVPSDLEQMPHLSDFLKDNGTFDTNDHTILISHTGGGILSSLTASTRTGTVRPSRTRTATSGRTARSGSRHLQVLDRQHRRRQPGEQPADAVCRHELQHGQQRLRRRSAARAPSATRRRRGCRTRARAATSATSASRTPCSRTTPRSVFRQRPRRSTAATNAERHEHQGRNRADFAAGQTIKIDQRREPRARDDRNVVRNRLGAGTINLTAA